jgi:hypothetical protein
MCVGAFQGAGMIQSIPISGLSTAIAAGNGLSYIALEQDKLIIPSGGIVNFKGTSSTPTYVDQACTSIAPHYATSNLIVDGWVFQCRNGIQECDR